jgi:predicted nucleic-acid-binding protein
MPSLDTTVLVRWLLDDDPVQAQRAEKLFAASRAHQMRLFIPSTVTLELEWVLRSRYQLDKAAALEHAIHLYRSASAEFADRLHAGLSRAAERAPLLTFDSKAARLADVELLAS